MEIAEVKRALADRAEAVCRHLLPSGKMDGNEWVCGDLSGSAGKSLKIVLTGEKAGLWRDFAGDQGSKNLLELWLQTRNLKFQEALQEAKEWLGVRGADKGPHTKVRQQAVKKVAKPVIKDIAVARNKVEAYLTVARKIPVEIVKAYKVCMTKDEKAIVFPSLSEHAPHAPQMVKYLEIERDADGKKKTWTSKDTAKVLFGKHTLKPSDRYLLITEGESDCMSWASLGLPDVCCVSVPFGAKWEGKDGRDPNEEWIANDWDFLHRFDRIYLSMDMDSAGEQARDAIVKRLGRDVCFVISLPVKDGNELLKAGRLDDMRLCFESAKTIDPQLLRNAGDFRDQVLELLFADEKVRAGIPMPWGAYPFHFRWHEWTLFTGLTSSGKSQVIGYLNVYLRSLGYSACIASMEVKPEKTVAFYVSQSIGRKTPEDKAEANAAIDWIASKFWVIDHVGDIAINELLEIFEYVFRRYGVNFFVIDSFMKLKLKNDDLDGQGDAAKAISKFVSKYPVHMFVVAHPKKMSDEAAEPNTQDVKGSGDISNEAFNVISVWRNRPKEAEIGEMRKGGRDEIEILKKQRGQPDARFIVKKQRNDDGDLPVIDLWFHKESKQYFSKFSDKGISFLKKEPPAAAEPETVAQGQIDEDTPF